MSIPATSPGLRLKAEREHRGLSAQKAADELHLDRWVIDALEAGDYKRIGPTVYAKGHLKKYAALLGLPTAEILAGYDSRAQEPSEPTSAGPSMLLSTRGDDPGMSNLSPAQILGCVAAVLLILGVLWWRPWHHREPAVTSGAPVPSASAAAPVSEDNNVGSAPTAPAVAMPTAVRDLPSGSSATDAAPPIAASNTPSPSAAAAPAVDAPVAGAGRARLRLSFSADSWVDVHDASGKRTYAGNGLANSVKTIAGAAPMRVYLGFGSGVQLEINDRVVAIGPQFFAGDVARFEAGADGVLRRDSHAEAPRGDASHANPSHTDPSHVAQGRSDRPSG
jgi:cytoskeleton protein RodZ